MWFRVACVASDIDSGWDVGLSPMATCGVVVCLLVSSVLIGPLEISLFTARGGCVCVCAQQYSLSRCAVRVRAIRGAISCPALRASGLCNVIF